MQRLDSLPVPGSVRYQMVVMRLLRMRDLLRCRASVRRATSLDFLARGLGPDPALTVERVVRTPDLPHHGVVDVRIVDVVDIYVRDRCVMSEDPPVPTPAGEA